MAVVLLPFPFAGDGYTLESLVAGDERDFGGCTDGLVAAGFIAVEAPEAVVDAEPGDEAVAEDDAVLSRGRKRK